MISIYKRELRSYFTSMIGYIYAAAILVFVGIYFTIYNLRMGYPSFSSSLASILMIFVVATPILTMKSMAEERRNRTDQLLLTAPVSVSSIVMGKFLSLVTVYAIPLVISCVCPVIIHLFGQTSYLVGDYASIFAVFCMGMLLLSIGLFISSLTENQIIAAVGSFVAILVLFMWDSIVQYLPTDAMGSFVGLLILCAAAGLMFYMFSKDIKLAVIVMAVGVIAVSVWHYMSPASFENLLVNMLSVFSIATPVENFVYNYVFDVGGIFYYLSGTALFLFLTVQTLQKRRWS